MSKEARNPLVRSPLVTVRDGGERLFDFDPGAMLVYIKSRWTGQLRIVDLKLYLGEGENLGG